MNSPIKIVALAAASFDYLQPCKATPEREDHMIIISVNKNLENFDIERLGKIYTEQVKAGVIVVPYGSKVEELTTPDGKDHDVLIVEEDNEPNIKKDE